MISIEILVHIKIFFIMLQLLISYRFPLKCIICFLNMYIPAKNICDNIYRYTNKINRKTETGPIIQPWGTIS